jgi:hypothetical protein
MRCAFPGRLERKHDKLSAGELEALFFIVDKRRFLSAILPSALFGEHVALGAHWAFSFQRVLPPDKRPLIYAKHGPGPGVIRSHPSSTAVFIKLIASATTNYAAAALLAWLFLSGS